MKIRVLYFGIVRERLGKSGEMVELDPGTTVAALIENLSRRYEDLAKGAGSIRVACNSEYVGSGHELGDDDEVAIIPPVAGG